MVSGMQDGSKEIDLLDISGNLVIIYINIRKAKTERVVYLKHTERKALVGGSLL